MPSAITGSGLSSIAKSDSAKLSGDVTLSEGTGVTLTQSGQDISIAAPAGGGTIASTTNLLIGDGAGNAVAAGNATFSGQLVATGIITPAQITADQNNYNPTGLSGATIIRLSSDVQGRSITGLQGGVAGRILILANTNTGANTINLTQEDTNSTDVNRFADGIMLPSLSQTLIIYDGTANRWRALQGPIGSTSSGAQFGPELGTDRDGLVSFLVYNGNSGGTNALVTMGTQASNSQLILVSNGPNYSGTGLDVADANQIWGLSNLSISTFNQPLQFSTDGTVSAIAKFNYETVASGAAAVLDSFVLPASTATVTGTTQITTAKGFNKVSIYLPTYTDASAVIIDQGATLYIEGAPLAAGSVTLTNPYALWVDSGTVRIDGNIDAPQVIQPSVKVVEPIPLQQVAGTIVSKAGTITGTDGVGSSLFLKRITIPSLMNLSEIDVAMSIGFPATNQGAGTMSRSMVLYSFGNSTSLASVVSASSAFAWNTGTSTAGASTSLRQFQGGWSSPLIQPMTFASSTIRAGEYVVGQLFNFAQASSTWTLNFYGPVNLNITSDTLGAMSSAALAAASGLTGYTQVSTNDAANIFWDMNRGSSTASSAKVSSSIWTVVQHAYVSSLLTLAGSMFTAATGSFGAVTNVGGQLNLPNFGYIGNGSTTSNRPTVFMNGIMSTGAIPAAITLTGAGITFSGSYAHQQPWFLMAGA